ncbi:MAG: alpha/beta hydrolase [Gammaproteobacteria bacterium]|nr:alpha/beta hydrolase [Gammaproteobacteria bacterium]
MIHFSHANGFPAETYHQIIKRLKNFTEVGYINRLGHDPNYPVVDNWWTLVNESLDYISTNYDQPVIAVGHSLGGVLSYFGCLKQPELFKAVVLLDAPIYGYRKIIFLNMLKKLKLMDYVTPAKVTKSRRMTWPSHQAAFEHFRTKKVFKYFDDSCLKDYISYGTELVDKDSSEIRLIFDPSIELEIYRTLPTVHIAKLPNNIACSLIYGEYSNVIRPNDVKVMAQDYDISCYKMLKCGHLFPFEKPEETVRKIIQSMELLRN